MRENDDGSLDAVGLASVEDKAKVINSIKKYVPPRLIDYINIVDFQYNDSENPKLASKRFQVVFVEGPAALLPFISTGEGEGIRAFAIYVRRGAESAEANDSEIQNLLENRLDAAAGSSQARDLKEHLTELQVLYSEIPRTQTRTPALSPSRKHSTEFASPFAAAAAARTGFVDLNLEDGAVAGQWSRRPNLNRVAISGRGPLAGAPDARSAIQRKRAHFRTDGPATPRPLNGTVLIRFPKPV